MSAVSNFACSCGRLSFASRPVEWRGLGTATHRAAISLKVGGLPEAPLDALPVASLADFDIEEPSDRGASEEEIGGDVPAVEVGAGEARGVKVPWVAATDVGVVTAVAGYGDEVEVAVSSFCTVSAIVSRV